jgi:hypothetical protein
LKLLVGRWGTELRRLLDGTQTRILIISPFVTSVAVSTLRPLAESKRVSCRLITRLNLNDFRSGVSDLAALRQLVEMGVEVRTLKGLHAKVYVFDDREAVVTSANFTGGGLSNEHEWGGLLSKSDCVEPFEESTALWGRLKRTLVVGDIDAISANLEEDRRSHPVAEIDNGEILQDEGEVPTPPDGSGLEIHLLPDVLPETIVSEMERISDADSRFGNNDWYAGLVRDLASTGGVSISTPSYLWLVGWSNTRATYGPASTEYVQPLALSMFGYVPERYLIVDGRPFDLKKYRYDAKRFSALDDRIIAYHRDHLGE